MKHNEFEKYYSEESFWDKVKKYALSLGKQGVIYVLTLFYALLDSDTPVWAKSVIAGALGYFILPIDFIPDFIPGVGYVDDLSIIASAIATVDHYIKDQHKMKAEEKWGEWFGE